MYMLSCAGSSELPARGHPHPGGLRQRPHGQPQHQGGEAGGRRQEAGGRRKEAEDSKDWTLDAGHRTLDTGHWTPHVEYEKTDVKPFFFLHYRVPPLKKLMYFIWKGSAFYDYDHFYNNFWKYFLPLYQNKCQNTKYKYECDLKHKMLILFR